MSGAAQRCMVVTGGRGALGSALAAAGRAAGWDVRAPGRGELDVTSETSVAAWFGSLTRLDLLVHCAGVRRDAPMMRLSAADFSAVVDVALRGAFLCVRAGLPQLAAARGHVVLVGSHSALTGPAGQAAYAAAKAGLHGLTRALAAELGPAGVRVNCVLPGWLETPFTADVPEAVRAAARRAQVLPHEATVAEAAAAILALDAIPGLSGQVIPLDSRPLALR